VAKCAYRGKKIREIEEKWIDENIKDKEERMRMKLFLDIILIELGENADCRLGAIPGREFCIFHDPDYWREHPNEVRKEFQKNLKENGEKLFIGFHLPSIKFPKVVKNNIHMELAKFHGPLEASKTELKELARFDGAVFFEEALFDEATFKNVRFSVATFKKSAQFDGATFDKAMFDVVTFKEASFTKVTFEELAHFDLAAFKGSVSFYLTTFKGLTSFVGATFEELASFDSATFEEVSFVGAAFKEASFAEAIFKGSVSFAEAKFLGRTSFNDSVFSRLASFKDSVILPDLLEGCLDPNNYVSFRRVSFGKSGKAIFDGCRMRRVSFIHTDMGGFIFRNVDWGEDFRIFDDKLFLLKIGKERESFLRECKEKLERILDVLDGKKEDKRVDREIELGEPEIMLTELKELKKKKEMSVEDKSRLEELEEKMKKLRSRIERKLDELRDEEKRNKIFKEMEVDDDLTLDNVLAVYRGLRDNYDYHLKYEESGKFFINEMRLRRIIGRRDSGEKLYGLRGLKMKLSNIIERAVMWTYEMLALYGESYTRPILWAIILIVLSSLIRPLWLWIQNPSWMPEVDFILKQVKTSILVFFQLQWDTKTLTIVERLLSIPILGTLILALRRKLERRMRH